MFSDRRLRTAVYTAVLLALPLLSLVMDNSYLAYVLDLTLVYVIAALGLNLLIGVSGQVSLGHAAFMAIGAYTSALLTAKLHLPFLVALPVAALASGVVGYLMGLPALRLHGPYLALATISFGAALPEVLGKWEHVTGGHAGLITPKPALGPLVLRSEVSMYYLELAIVAFLVWFAANLLKTRFGRAWQALRESETAAQSMGVNLALAKTSAFAVSATYAGIAGSLYAHLVGFVSPLDFNLFMSSQLLAMIVVGGLGSIAGGVMGAVAITILMQLVSRTKGWALIIEGVIVIAVVWFVPYGLAGLGRTIRYWRAARAARARAAATGQPVAKMKEEEAV